MGRDWYTVRGPVRGVCIEESSRSVVGTLQLSIPMSPRISELLNRFSESVIKYPDLNLGSGRPGQYVSFTITLLVS